MKQLRQGDVLLVPVDKLPGRKKDRRIRKNGILAYGEVTGHSHALADVNTAAVMVVGSQLYLDVKEATDIVHQEHGTVTAPPGQYQVRIQTEWSPEGVRKVLD